MNDLMPRLHSHARGAELAQALPDLSLVRRETHLPNTWAKGRPTRQGAFNPGHDCASGVGGLRAQRADAADAMRRWMFDPTAEQCAAGGRADEADQEAQVSEAV